MIAARLVTIAAAEVGTEEIGNTNCGPRVNEYKAATNLPPAEAWPWCAAFVCWCVREAMKTGGPYTFKRPTTAGALDLENWSLKQDNSTHTKVPPRGDIQPGDIITFKFASGGHTGFAVTAPGKDGYFFSIEGNTDAAGSREGGGVWRKRRHVGTLHGRIRFTV